MIDLNNEIKNEINNDIKNDKINRELSPREKKRRNIINKFLNSYFKFLVIAFVLFFLWLSLRFILLPKFNKMVHSSDNFLREKKSEFLIEYTKLNEYEKIISEFSRVNEQDIYQIEKIVPTQYSRDDLFTELTYFLIKNNFKIKSINIIDPQAITPVIPEVPTRRPTNTENQEQPLYTKHVTSLPSGVGYYVADISLSDIDYSALRYLVDVLESNLKLIDIFSLDFYPGEKSANLSILTYYRKNN